MNKLPEPLEAWASSTWNKLRIMRKVWTWTEGVEMLYEHLMRPLPGGGAFSVEELYAMVKARDETIQGLHAAIQDLNIELSAVKQSLAEHESDEGYF